MLMVEKQGMDNELLVIDTQLIKQIEIRIKVIRINRKINKVYKEYEC